MKEMNIGRTIVAKRKEKGRTQEALAHYIGVSKASVSKWETRQSYPDITFLPQLTAYFNISIDELIGYSPQMTKEDIKHTYHRLSLAFSKQPFDNVLSECETIIKKYYSCFPLLMQMVILLVNHCTLAKDKETQMKVLQDAIQLCDRIKAESEDVWLSKQANSMATVCHILLHQHEDTLELLEGTIKPVIIDEIVLSNAYMLSGNPVKARTVLQVSRYQSVNSLVGVGASYLLQHANDVDKFKEILR